MAGSKKARKLTKPESDEESGSENNSESFPNEIQATFEGRNLESQDFHGIKQLLQQLFVTAHIDTSHMCEMLINQTGIGSVLKQGLNDSDDEEDVEMIDENDVFGITSVVNLSQYKETPCVKQLLQHIDAESKKCADNETHTQLKQILESSSKIGFLINERFINIPTRIAYPMFNTLQNEIDRMKKKDNSYGFDYYLMICKTWKSKGTEGEIEFSNDEEQIIQKIADYSFSYSVAGQSDTGLTGQWESEDKEMMPFRAVVMFKADKFPSILTQIHQLVYHI